MFLILEVSLHNNVFQCSFQILRFLTLEKILWVSIKLIHFDVNIVHNKLEKMTVTIYILKFIR